MVDVIGRYIGARLPFCHQLLMISDIIRLSRKAPNIDPASSVSGDVHSVRRVADIMSADLPKMDGFGSFVGRHV
jgi:hypothetical protein